MGSLLKLCDGQSRLWSVGKTLPWIVANSSSHDATKLVTSKDQQKRPPTAFCLFYTEKLPNLRMQHPDKPVSQLMKLASTMWKTESAFTHNRYRNEYNRKMEEYKKRLPPAPASPPRKPATAYAQFLVAVNASLMKQMPNTTLAERSKRASAVWRNLPEERKKFYQSRYQTQMEAYKKKLTEEDIDLLQKKKDLLQAKRKQAKAEQDQKDLEKYGKYGISERPERPRATPVSLYVAEQSAKVEGDKEAMKSVREKWSSMSDAQKKVYEKKVEEVFKKFDKDYETWEKKYSQYEDAVKECPSKPISSYGHFIRGNAGHKSTDGRKFLEVMAERWANMSEQQKMPFASKYEASVVTYKGDMERWEKKYSNILGK